MNKADAIYKIKTVSNFSDLNNRNTHFSNINTTLFKGRNIWWAEVPSRKFETGFNLLFCNKDQSLVFLKIPKNAIDFKLLSYREDTDSYRFYICSDGNHPQYMHDLKGSGNVNLKKFAVGEYE